MRSVSRLVRRLLALCLSLLLMLPLVCGVRAAEEADIYIRPLAGYISQVAIGADHIAVLRSDGTVAATGSNDRGQCDVGSWSRIVKIWAGPGVTLGLTDQGELLNTAGTMRGWKNIVDVDVAAVSTANMTVVAGLKADGTAVSLGINARGIVPFTKDVCNVTGWADMVQVVVYEGIYGLKADGTVLGVGFPEAQIPGEGQSDIRELVRTGNGVFAISQTGNVYSQSGDCGWENVVKVLAGDAEGIYGLTADGRLLSGGEGAADTGALADLTDAAIGASRIVGLKNDGSVMFSPDAEGMDWDRRQSWNGAKALVFAPGSPTVAVLREDGTVVASDISDPAVPTEPDGWTDVVRLFCGGSIWVGLQENGTLLCNVPEMDMEALRAGVKNTRPQEETVDLIAAGIYHSIYVRNDGSVTGVGQSTMGRLDVGQWTDIVAVAAAAHTVGIKANGTVVAVGPNGSGQCDVSHWEDIVDVGAGYLNTIGLDRWGNVVVAGGNDYGQLALAGRQGIVDVAAGGSTVYAVTNKGAVYCAGNDAYGQADVEGWSSIIAISAGTSHVVGLRADGTVVAAGNNENGQCDVESWSNIIAVAAGSTHTVGLKSNGTVVFAGSNAFGQSEVEGWSDVVAISAGAYHTLGITGSGSILAAGSNSYGQCDVSY